MFHEAAFAFVQPLRIFQCRLAGSVAECKPELVTMEQRTFTRQSYEDVGLTLTLDHSD